MSSEATRASARRAADVERLVEKISRPALSRGLEPRQVGLTALSACMFLLGTPAELRRAFLTRLGGGSVCAVQATRTLFACQEQAFPYLVGNLSPLTDWLEDAAQDTARRDALRETFAVLSKVDLVDWVEDPVIGGDLVGPVYSVMRSASEKAGQGAYYTPASVCRLLAELVPVGDHETVNEPACGSAGMIVAQIRAMRARGAHPETVCWVLEDIDPMAVALAGINMSSHGMPLVVLQRRNVLLPSG